MNQLTSRFVRGWATMIGLCITLLAPASLWAADAPVKLQSLRGAEVSAADPVGEGTRFGPDTPALPRDFVQQPPLIPHTIEGYLVSKEFNKCMDCHAWSRAREMRATKISITHFKSREGAEMSSVSPNRYFCSQCHVSQTDAKPLVGNVFKPGTGLR